MKANGWSVARRVAVWTGRILGIALGLVLLALAAVFIGLEFPQGRAYVARQVNDVLKESFVGKVEIVSFERVGLAGAGGLKARVFDGKSRQIVEVEGASVQLSVLALVKNLLGSGPLHIPIQSVEIAHTDLRLIDDGEGVPSLVSAFDSRTPSTSTSSEVTTVSLEKIRMGHVWVHGSLAALPVIDVDLERLQAALHVDVKSTRIRVDALSITGRSLPTISDLTGQLTGSVSIPSSTKEDLVGSLKFQGWLASAKSLPAERSALNLQAAIAGKVVTATAHVDPLGPSLMKRLAPGVALRHRSEATLSVSGTLPALDVQASVISGPARIEVKGSFESLEPLRAKAAVVARDVDASAIVEGAPASQVDFNLDTSLVVDASALQANYALVLEKSELNSVELPPSTINGHLSFGLQNQELRTKGELIANEPGAPTTVQFSFETPEGNLQFTSRSVLSRPARLASLVPGLGLAGTLDVAGTLNVPRETLSVESNALLADVVLSDGKEPPSVRVRRAQLRGRAEGPLANPRIQAIVEGSDVRAAQQSLRSARVEVKGTPASMAIVVSATAEDDRTVHAATELALTESVDFRQTRITYKDRDLVLETAVRRLQIANGRIAIDGAELRGAGELQFSGVFSDSLDRMELATKKLDIARLVRSFTKESWVHAGQADLTARYQAGRQGGTGEIKGAISGIAVDRIKNGNVRLDLQLDAGFLSGPVDTKLGDTASFMAVLDKVGPVPQLIAGGDLQQLRGSLKARGHFRLARVLGLLGPELVPLDSATGALTLELDVVRESAGLPQVQARVRTEKLKLVGKRVSGKPIETVAEARAQQPWSVAGIDVDASLNILPQESPRLTGRLFDQRGELIAFEVIAPAQLPPSLDPATILREARTLGWEARARITGRDLQHLPESFKVPEWEGIVAGTVEARGTLARPEVDLAFSARNLRPSSFGGPKASVPRLDVDLQGAYRDDKGVLNVAARSQDRARAKLTAEFEATPLGLAQIGASDRSSITGRMDAELVEFPIDIVPALRARGLSGRLNARAALRDFGRAASLTLEVASSVSIGELKRQKLTGAVSLKGQTLLVKTELAQNTGTSQATLRSGVSWGDRWVPRLEEPMQAELNLRQLEFSVFQPLLIDNVTDLGGRLDAHVVADLGQGRSEARGFVRLAEGSVSVPAVGQRFNNMNASIALRPGKITLEELQANGITGKLTAKGYATFDGVEPTFAELGVWIKKQEKLPVTIEGMTVGDMWGRVALRYQPGKGQADSLLEVSVPKLQLELAATPPNSVQSMEEAEGVRIGVRFPDRFATLPLQPLLKDAEPGPPGSAMVIRVTLGDDVTIAKGIDLEAKLTGTVDIRTADGAQIAGQIQVRGGAIDVTGKQFKIERGTVTFREQDDPGNPTVVATARWDSPTEYSVFADFAGPVESGTLTLRSEPPLSEDEILTLILFGTPDGNIGTGGGGGNAAAAAGLVAGTATKGMNRALSRVSNLDVSTRVDTSTGSSRPELVVQITPRVAARVTRALAEPTAGQSPDRTFLTLDIRLLRKWSLAAQVGDQGASSLDLVWRHRY